MIVFFRIEKLSQQHVQRRIFSSRNYRKKCPSHVSSAYAQIVPIAILTQDARLTTGIVSLCD